MPPELPTAYARFASRVAGSRPAPPAAPPAAGTAEQAGGAPPATALPRERLLVGICLLALTVLQLIRQPDYTRNVVWAEDGGVFLSDAYNTPFFTALGQPYGSYLHLVPRTVMWAVARFPVEWASSLIALAAAVGVTLLAFYVYHLSAALFDTRWARATIAVFMVLLPQAGYETNATVINLHWYLIFASFWVLVAAPRSARGIALGAVVVGATVMSDPLVGLLAPLCLVGLLKHRSPRALVIPGVLAVGLVVQYAVATAQQPLGEPDRDLAALPSIYALRVVGSFLVGDVWLDNFWRQLGYGFTYSALAFVVAFCAFGAVKADRATRLFVAASLVLSFALHSAPLILRGTEEFLDPATFTLNGSRYFLVPVLLVAAAVLKVLDFHVSARRAPGPALANWRTAQIMASLLLGGLILTNFSVGNVRTAGPFWVNELKNAREKCTAPAGTAPVPVAPPVKPPPFVVAVPCERLR